MPSPFMKKIIQSLMPKGSIWLFKSGGNADLFFDGLADSFETIRSRLSELAGIRNAIKTTVLDELERDYGIPFNPDLTEAQRRAILDSRMNSIDNTGSRQELEMALQRAGFPLFVYQNSPAVDPRNFENRYLMTANDDDSFADNENAIAGSFQSDIVVNGDIIIDTPIYFMTADDDSSFADDENAIAGVTGQKEVEYEYFIPEDSSCWPFIFFAGGVAEFAETGEIIAIETVDISDNRRLELRALILKYKPEFTWCVLKVNYI